MKSLSPTLFHSEHSTTQVTAHLKPHGHSRQCQVVQLSSRQNSIPRGPGLAGSPEGYFGLVLSAFSNETAKTSGRRYSGRDIEVYMSLSGCAWRYPGALGQAASACHGLSYLASGERALLILSISLIADWIALLTNW